MAKEQVDIKGACCMKDDQGNIVTEATGIKTIWRSYLERLLNVENIVHSVQEVGALQMQWHFWQPHWSKHNICLQMLQG